MKSIDPSQLVLPLLMSGFGGIGLFGGILLSLDFIVVFDLLI